MPSQIWVRSKEELSVHNRKDAKNANGFRPWIVCAARNAVESPHVAVRNSVEVDSWREDHRSMVLNSLISRLYFSGTAAPRCTFCPMLIVSLHFGSLRKRCLPGVVREHDRPRLEDVPLNTSGI